MELTSVQEVRRKNLIVFKNVKSCLAYLIAATSFFKISPVFISNSNLFLVQHSEGTFFLKEHIQKKYLRTLIFVAMLIGETESLSRMKG